MRDSRPWYQRYGVVQYHEPKPADNKLLLADILKRTDWERVPVETLEAVVRLVATPREA